MRLFTLDFSSRSHACFYNSMGTHEMSSIHDILNNIASKVTLSIQVLVKQHHNLMIPVRAHAMRNFTGTLIFNLCE